MTTLAVFCFVVFVITDLVYFVPLDFTTAVYLPPWMQLSNGINKDTGVNEEYFQTKLNNLIIKNKTCICYLLK